MTNTEKDNLKAEIEKQRLEFKRDAEKKIYEEMLDLTNRLNVHEQNNPHNISTVHMLLKRT